MASHSEILGISSDSTMEQIESAFQEKSEYWRRLQANPKRSAEASAMVEQVIVAYETLRAQYQSTASGLEYREPRSFSGQAGVAPVDKERCPHCGHKGNPPDARFCLSCRDQLFQLCPSCQRELPWHYQNCHLCGADIEVVRQEQARQQRLQELELFRARDQKLEEINRQIMSLTAVESRIRSLGIGGNYRIFLKGSEEGQWSRKDDMECGDKLVDGFFTLLGIGIGWIVGVTFVYVLGLDNNVAGIFLGTIIGASIWLLFYFTTSGNVIHKPRALVAIAKERAMLEREKRELAQAPKP